MSLLIKWTFPAEWLAVEPLHKMKIFRLVACRWSSSQNENPPLSRLQMRFWQNENSPVLMLLDVHYENETYLHSGLNMCLWTKGNVVQQLCRCAFWENEIIRPRDWELFEITYGLFIRSLVHRLWTFKFIVFVKFSSNNHR